MLVISSTVEIEASASPGDLHKSVARGGPDSNRTLAASRTTIGIWRVGVIDRAFGGKPLRWERRRDNAATAYRGDLKAQLPRCLDRRIERF
jgi:hypothetical protein